MAQPFDGITLIDLSTVLAGPSVGTFFAELGAKVIKIEHPIHKDVTRSWKLPSEDKNADVSAYFSSVNYQKEYILMDFTKQSDKEELIKLCESADILLMNFKKGDQTKLGITDAVLRARNPRLIIGKISGFGEDSDRVAYDLILQAESGIMSMNGTPESGPLKMPIALIDVLAAHHLKEGLLVALLARLKSEYGNTVSVSLYDAAVSSLVNQASNYLMAGHVSQPIGSLHPNIAPYGELFTTKDNVTITFAIGSNKHFSLMCSELDLEHLLELPQFKSVQERVKNRLKLAELIQDKIEQRESAELLTKMHSLLVPCARINSIEDVFREPEAKNLIRVEKINNIETKRVTSVAFTIE